MLEQPTTQTCRGSVFNIMRYSTQDGPGLRTTVFLKGCPLECIWCHNPESMKTKQEFVYREVRCLRCGACVDVCPQNAVEMNGNGHVRREEDCIWCGTCVNECAAEARELIGNEMTPEELLTEILKDLLFYEESGGGVTFSGGEPMAQPDFLLRTLALCKRNDIHTAIDTSGAVAWERIEAVAPLTDLFLYDIKCVSGVEHQSLTGVSNKQIITNLRRLDALGAKIIIRIPVVPGINDNAEQLEATVTLIRSLSRKHPVVLLPYHSSAEGKFSMLNQKYELGNLKPPSEEQMRKASHVFASRGIDVSIGGTSYE